MAVHRVPFGPPFNPNIAARLERASSEAFTRTTNLPNFNSTYTWMAWIYLSSDVGGYATFFSMSTAVGFNYELIQVSSDGTTLSYQTEGSGEITGSNLSTGRWYHIALVRESATSLKMYLNGVQNGTTITSDVSSRAACVRLAIGRTDITGFVDEYIDARIAAVKLFSTSMTPGQVYREMRQTAPDQQSGLLGFWDFAAPNRMIYDQSIYRSNLAIVGTPTTEQGPGVPYQFAIPRRYAMFPIADAPGGTSVKDLIGMGMIPWAR